MITTTLGDLVVSLPALRTIGALPLSAKAAYHIAKLARLVVAETKHFDEVREAAVKEFGEEKDGQIEVKQTGANWTAFAARVNDVAAVPVEIAWGPITIDMLGAHQVSANDLLALGALFAEPAEG